MLSRINLDITYKCNASCIHCSRNSNSGIYNELTTSEWINIIDDSFNILPKKGASYILQGGEPTISPAFFQISTKIREMYPSEFELYTSADQVINLWKSNRNMLSFATNGITLGQFQNDFQKIGYENIRVSLDGASSEKNDAIRVGVKFDLLKKNLEKVAKKLPIQLGFVVLKQNAEEAVKIIELANQLGIYSIRLTPFFPIGRGKNLVSQRLSLEEYTNLVNNVQTKLSELNDPPFVSLGCPEPYAKSIIDKLGIKLNKNNLCGEVPLCLSIHKCYAFSNEVTITPEGYVTGCCYMSILDSFRAGNLREQSFVEIINSDKYKDLLKLKENSLLSETCLNCECNDFCKGKCMIFSKNGENIYCDKL